MRFSLPIALALGAGLAGCSDPDDLGRSVAEGPIQGRHLDDHDHHHDHEGHEEGDCDEEHDHEAEDCEDDHGGADPAELPAERADGASGSLDAPREGVGAADLAPASAQEDSVAAFLSEPPPPEPVAVAAHPELAASQAAGRPAAPPSAAPARGSARFDRARYTWIDFDPMIEFDYPELVRVDGDTPPPELPAEVRALHGKRVAIEGFMSPLAFDAGGEKEFSLVKDPSFCCFGAVPQMNHWIHVVMPDKERTEFYSFDPIAVYGVLEVGEQYEDGYVVSLYRMVADKVEGDF